MYLRDCVKVSLFSVEQTNLLHNLYTNRKLGLDLLSLISKVYKTLLSEQLFLVPGARRGCHL